MYDENVAPRKKGGFWKKVFSSIGCGLLFGLFAGIAFFGIKTVYEMIPLEKLLTEAGIKDERPSAMDTEFLQTLCDSGVPVAQLDDLEIQEEVISGESMGVIEVVKQAMPSIVSVYLTSDIHYYGTVQEVNSAGSGIIVGQNEEELLLVTNYHVVEGGKEITVQFFDGSESVATVKGQDISMDLAVMAVELDSLTQETKDTIKIIQLGDSDSLEVGESVIAIGNALGYGQSVTTGIISALNREMTLENGEIGTFIQTDAAINQGNSGGALINSRGELIGINSNKLGGTYVEGMGYAIPISAAEPIMSKLMNKEDLVELPEEEQSYLGISGATLTSTLAAQQSVRPPLGIYIADILSDGPAETAGLRRGDVITEFDGNSIATMEELKEYLAAYPSGTTVTITYERLENGAYTEYECQVLLQNKPS